MFCLVKVSAPSVCIPKRKVRPGGPGRASRGIAAWCCRDSILKGAPSKPTVLSCSSEVQGQPPDSDAIMTGIYRDSVGAFRPLWRISLTLQVCPCEERRIHCSAISTLPSMSVCSISVRYADRRDSRNGNSLAELAALCMPATVAARDVSSTTTRSAKSRATSLADVDGAGRPFQA